MLKLDFRDVLDIKKIFYDCFSEFIIFKIWIFKYYCCFIVILGISGVSKSIIICYFIFDIEFNFDNIIWYIFCIFLFLNIIFKNLIEIIFNVIEINFLNNIDIKC